MNRRMLTAVVTTVLAGATLTSTTAASASLPAAHPQAPTCTPVAQYNVTQFGDLTDAPSNGNVIGYGYAGDIFNVRQTGSPRYYGAIAATGKFGWFLSSKLSFWRNNCI